MDARSYLKQVKHLHSTILTLQMRLHEMEYSVDMLQSAKTSGMPHGSSDGKKLENMIITYIESAERYVTELQRWTALKSQAIDMLDEARRQLTDGESHWIGTMHIDVLEQHYVQRMTYDEIADIYGLSTRTVKRYEHEAVNWLDNATDADGYPLVPIVSE